MKTFEEFKQEIEKEIANSPKEWRKGQACYNIIDKKYNQILSKVALDVLYYDFDPFYDDEKIEDFLKLVYNELNKHSKTPVLLVSRIQTPDGTILESHHTHDYQPYIDKNGEFYFIDGGRSYKRTSVNKEPAKDISIYNTSPFEEIRENLTRFSTKDGKVYKLKDMSTDWLYSILEYDVFNNIGIRDDITMQYMRELVYRYNKLVYKYE